MKYPCQNNKAATRNIDGEAVVVSPDNATLHNLNEIGTVIWEMATGSNSMTTIAETLTHDYKVEPDQALEDVTIFCETLAGKELMQIFDTPQGG